MYDAKATQLQAAFQPTSLLTPPPEGDGDGGDHDADDENGAGKNGQRGGPRTVIDELTDIICSAYIPDESSGDKANPAQVAIEQMVIKVRTSPRVRPTCGVGPCEPPAWLIARSTFVVVASVALAV